MIKLKLRISAINPILIILFLLIPVLAISQDAMVLQDHQKYRKEVVENMQKVQNLQNVQNVESLKKVQNV